mmetsp:Transcript_8685/g.16698  ORF Transcript_8685/g.16698 Transcript_8685/m.16698 type:complete len:216 (+) Transcript_8685:406-1053(+)
MDATQEHRQSTESKNGKEQMNVGNATELRNHDAHERSRQGVFGPTKGILMTGNVVFVRGTKDGANQVIDTRQDNKGGRIPRDGKGCHLFGTRATKFFGIFVAVFKGGWIKDVPKPFRICLGRKVEENGRLDELKDRGGHVPVKERSRDFVQVANFSPGLSLFLFLCVSIMDTVVIRTVGFDVSRHGCYSLMRLLLLERTGGVQRLVSRQIVRRLS